MDENNGTNDCGYTEKGEGGAAESSTRFLIVIIVTKTDN
jgi:hypothetical protein